MGGDGCLFLRCEHRRIRRLVPMGLYLVQLAAEVLFFRRGQTVCPNVPFRQIRKNGGTGSIVEQDRLGIFKAAQDGLLRIQRQRRVRQQGMGSPRLPVNGGPIQKAQIGVHIPGRHGIRLLRRSPAGIEGLFAL